MERKTGRKIKNNIFLVIAILVMLGFGVAFAYHSYGYFLWWRDGQSAEENTRIVREIFAEKIGLLTALSTEAETAVFSNTSPVSTTRELTKNLDIIAFIHIEGTNISNVVMQGDNNDFYLYHDMFGTPNVNGSVFMDFRNSPDFTDKNTIIYGHNMRNGTMFHNLRYYLTRDFFEAHPLIKIFTDTKVLIYEIFSTFSTHVDFEYIQVHFNSDKEFGGLIGEIMRRRAFDTGIAARRDDRLLILSTCTNVDEDTRFVVAARLTQTISIIRP